eukprot:3184923-Pyramimonas_sp.AAC.1
MDPFSEPVHYVQPRAPTAKSFYGATRLAHLQGPGGTRRTLPIVARGAGPAQRASRSLAARGRCSTGKPSVHDVIVSGLSDLKR